METKGIIISQKDYERLTELEKNFDAKVDAKVKETFSTTIGLETSWHKTIMATQKDTIVRANKIIRNLWWSFGLTFVAWIIMSIAYITK